MPSPNQWSIPKTGGKKSKFVHVGPSMPSLRPDLAASPSADATILFKAFKGLGCDSRVVMNVLARRTSAQREAIKRDYYSLYKKDLISRVKSELYDPLERCMISLLYTGAELDAYLLKKATKGFGTDESALRDILCTRSSAQILQIKSCYRQMFSHDLDKDIRVDTSGSFRQILITLCNEPRDQTATVDDALAIKDAGEMMTRSLIKISAPSSLIQIFCKRSYTQLMYTFQKYYQMTGNSVFNYLKSYMRGDYEKTLMTIYQFVVNPLHYYSKHLKDAILGMKIYQVIRVVCTRCEIDLATILWDYEMMYKGKVVKEVKAAFEDNNPDTVRALTILMGDS